MHLDLQTRPHNSHLPTLLILTGLTNVFEGMEVYHSHCILKNPTPVTADHAVDRPVVVFCGLFCDRRVSNESHESHWLFSLPENAPYRHSVHCNSLDNKECSLQRSLIDPINVLIFNISASQPARESGLN
jgi:hypothetical protein